MIKQISITGRVPIDLPAENALAVLWDIKTLELYEPKVSSVQVQPAMGKKGTYSTTGRFAGIAWEGEFSYELNNYGFHSEMITGPMGIKVDGGFIIKSEGSERCLITHYETYHFPRVFIPLVPLIRIYLYWAMKKELRDLARIIYDKFSAGIKPRKRLPISVRSYSNRAMHSPPGCHSNNEGDKH